MDTATQNPGNPTQGPPQLPTVPKKALLVGGGRVNAIVPQDFDAAYRMANIVHAAGMAPKSLDSVEKVCVAIMHGLEVGFTPMAAIQSIAVINGVPSIFGDGLLALCLASGLLEDYEETQQLDEQGVPEFAICKVKRAGMKWHEQMVTRSQAQRAGWWGKAGPWTQSPQRMLQMRARSWALRDRFADVLRGLHSAEEMMDLPVDVTARGSATTTAPPEPRRADFVTTPAAAQAPPLKEEINSADTSTVAADPSSGQDPRTGGDPVRPKSWAVNPTQLGEAPKLQAVVDLLDLAETWQEVDEIAECHKEFLGKLGRPKADTRRAFTERKIVLGWKPVGDYAT